MPYNLEKGLVFPEKLGVCIEKQSIKCERAKVVVERKHSIVEPKFRSRSNCGI